MELNKAIIPPRLRADKAGALSGRVLLGWVVGALAGRRGGLI